MNKTRFHPAQRRIIFFLGGIAGLSFAALFFSTIPPKGWSIIGIGIAILSITTCLFLCAITNNVRRGLLWSGGVGIALFLQAGNLRDLIYLIVLFAIIVLIELALKNK